MEARISGIELLRCVYTFPAFSGCFRGRKGTSVILTVPIVEFMSGNFFSGFTEHIIMIGFQVNISKSGELSGIKAFSGQEAHHRKFADRFRQIHEAPHSAIRNTLLESRFDGSAHSIIFTEPHSASDNRPEYSP